MVRSGDGRPVKTPLPSVGHGRNLAVQQFAGPVDDATEGDGHRLEPETDPEQWRAATEPPDDVDAHTGAFRGAGAG